MKTNNNIDFISKAKIALFLSLGIIILGIGSLIVNKGPNLSIDFVGGTVIQISSANNIDVNKVRDLLSSTILDKSEVTEITGMSTNQQFRIKTNLKIEDTTQISSLIMQSLRDYDPEIRAIESVGQK